MNTKVCTICKEEFEANTDNFYKNKGGKLGLSSRCKKCVNISIYKNRKKSVSGESNIDINIKRLCYKCNKEKPATEKYFYKSCSDKLGIQSICRTCEKTRRDQYYLDNKKDIIKRTTKYKKDNIESHRTYYREYGKNKRATDPSYRIKNNLRRRINEAIALESKADRSLKLLGLCSIKYFKLYLESQFEAGMTWDNYGEWHIDHIIPCSLYDFSIEQNQFKCFNYRNMRPLWAKENRQKYNDLDIDLIRSHDIEDLLP